MQVLVQVRMVMGSWPGLHAARATAAAATMRMTPRSGRHTSPHALRLSRQPPSSLDEKGCIPAWVGASVTSQNKRCCGSYILGGWIAG